MDEDICRTRPSLFLCCGLESSANLFLMNQNISQVQCLKISFIILMKLLLKQITPNYENDLTSLKIN